MGAGISAWESVCVGAGISASGVRINVWELGSVRRESGLVCGSWDQCVGSQD